MRGELREDVSVAASMETAAFLTLPGGSSLTPPDYVRSQSENSTMAHFNSTCVSAPARVSATINSIGGFRQSSSSFNDGGFGSRIRRSSIGRRPRNDDVTVPNAGETLPGEIINNVPSPALGLEEFGNQWARKPRRIAVFVEPSPFA